MDKGVFDEGLGEFPFIQQVFLSQDIVETLLQILGVLEDDVASGFEHLF